MKTIIKYLFAGLLVAAAVGIWIAKIHEGNEQLKRLEMPDFKIERGNKPSVPWNGLAEARSNADAAFNSPSEIYERAVKQLRELPPLPAAVAEQIRVAAEKRWPGDYKMQVYEIEDQTAAWHKLHP